MEGRTPQEASGFDRTDFMREGTGSARFVWARLSQVSVTAGGFLTGESLLVAGLEC